MMPTNMPRDVVRLANGAALQRAAAVCSSTITRVGIRNVVSGHVWISPSQATAFERRSSRQKHNCLLIALTVLIYRHAFTTMSSCTTMLSARPKLDKLHVVPPIHPRLGSTWIPSPPPCTALVVASFSLGTCCSRSGSGKIGE